MTFDTRVVLQRCANINQPQRRNHRSLARAGKPFILVFTGMSLDTKQHQQIEQTPPQWCRFPPGTMAVPRPRKRGRNRLYRWNPGQHPCSTGTRFLSSVCRGKAFVCGILKHEGHTTDAHPNVINLAFLRAPPTGSRW